MEDEPYSLLENRHVEAGGIVMGLVVVHRDSGGEQHRRHAVLDEDLLVADPAVEDIGELLASEIVEPELKVDAVSAVAPAEQVRILLSDLVPAEHDDEILPARLQPARCPSYLVNVHHHPYPVGRDDIPGDRVDEPFLLDHVPQCP